MKIVIYLALVIHIFVMLNGVHTIVVAIKESKTGLPAENGTEIECLYKLEDNSDVFIVIIEAFNRSSSIFNQIATYRPEKISVIPQPGQYLKERVTLTNITKSSKKAVLTFSKLMCIDDTVYKCQVKYVDSMNSFKDQPSNNISITVKVAPSTPDYILLVHMAAKLSLTTTKHMRYSYPSPTITPKEYENVSVLESVTFKNTTTITYSTILTTDYDTTSSMPLNDNLTSNIRYRTTPYSTQKTTTAPGIVEGDDISIICAGDVGKPPAEYVFEKYLNGHILPSQYTNFTTSISELSENCSYYRTSSISFEVSAKDNNAVIRCVVNSSMAEPDMYIETHPIEVYYPVRIPTIINYPNKTDYVLGKDTSIHLACKSDGNPRPSYYWYKENPKQQVSSNKNFTITNMNKTNSGIYTCAVNNTLYGNTYQKAAYVKIKIINAVGESTPSISGTGDDKAKEKYTNLLIGIGIAGGFLIFALIIAYICRRRAKRKRNGARNRNEQLSNKPKDEFEENRLVYLNPWN